MMRNGDRGPHTLGFRAEVVAIVTGGSSGPGRDVARRLASWGWAIVVVYLEDQRAAEATVTEILAAEGKVVAIRANLADELDVQRLFAESSAAFGRVDVVVHTTSDGASLLYQQAERQVRGGGAIVGVVPPDRAPAGVESQLGERGISIGTIPRDDLLAFLDRWRQHAASGGRIEL